VVPRLTYTAVARNCVKRRIREVVRAKRVQTPLSGDVVILAHGAAYGVSAMTLRLELESLWNRAAAEA
jgi:ribonuclease P protein component